MLMYQLCLPTSSLTRCFKDHLLCRLGGLNPVKSLKAARRKWPNVSQTAFPSSSKTTNWRPQAWANCPKLLTLPSDSKRFSMALISFTWDFFKKSRNRCDGMVGFLYKQPPLVGLSDGVKLRYLWHQHLTVSSPGGMIPRARNSLISEAS